MSSSTPPVSDALSVVAAPTDRVEAEDRRRFLHRIFPAVGWASLGAVTLAGGAATVGFFFPRVLYEPPSAFFAGRPDEYSEGEVSERHVATQRVWIVRTRAGLYAMQARCTHLGCSPTWFAEERVFKCPCHGSTFSVEGDVLGGPAPQPLFRLALRLTDDGQLLVDRAVSENRPGARAGAGFLLGK